jgi:hypothetical protein
VSERFCGSRFLEVQGGVEEYEEGGEEESGESDAGKLRRHGGAWWE